MKNCFAVALAPLALATLALVGLSGAARADLTVSGAVGLPLNPTAQIPQPGGARIQANYYDQGGASVATTAGIADLNAKNYGLFAAGRAGSTLEISGGVEQGRLSGSLAGQSDSSSDSGIALGAKYLFTRESDPAGVRLAAGIGYDKVQLRNTFAYVVATKYLGEVTEDKVPITGHVGLRYDRFNLGDLTGVSGDNASRASVYAGVEVPFGGSFAAVGELQSKRISGGDVPYSAAIRYRSKGAPFGASLGYQRSGIGFGGGIFAQVGYSFGTR